MSIAELPDGGRLRTEQVAGTDPSASRPTGRPARLQLVPNEPRRALRVLHLTQASAPGGIQRLFRELVPLQVERGLIVGVACPATNGLDPVVRRAGAAGYEWPATRAISPTSFRREFRRVRRVIADFQPDVVHMHSSKAGLIGRLAYRGPAIFQPQAWSFHHVPALARPLIEGWERLGQRLVTTTVCSSYDEQVEGAEHGVTQVSAVIENGISLDDFPVQTCLDRRAARAALGLDPNAPIAACIGRLCRQKGQDLLFDAWPDVLRRAPDARLLLVGSGPDEERLRARQPDSVAWIGWQTDVRPYLAAADLIVMPSRWEGMSFGLIEALASGRSIVATNATGMRENIEPFDAGAIVELGPSAAEQLAEQITVRFADPQLAAREGVNGRARAEELSIERMEHRLYDAYCDIARVGLPGGGSAGGKTRR